MRLRAQSVLMAAECGTLLKIIKNAFLRHHQSVQSTGVAKFGGYMEKSTTPNKQRAHSMTDVS